MRVQLYASKTGAVEPNLVAWQHPGLAALPTVLVCPLRAGVSRTPVRVEISRNGKSFIVACDLIRPVNRKLLRAMGELDEATSQAILSTFSRLLLAG
jgi:mRNA-degrading endonuclease toxin of MazEF toxin-antitoxin module